MKGGMSAPGTPHPDLDSDDDYLKADRYGTGSATGGSGRRKRRTKRRSKLHKGGFIRGGTRDFC